MKAVAVVPGQAHSVHLVDVPEPSLGDIEGDGGVIVKVLGVGVDGTDKEINEGEYGAAPDGSKFLILGHESVGVVIEAGPAAAGLSPGDLVAALVRRPGTSIYDRLGMSDMTTDDVYLEHGISRVHGFLTERYAESADRLVKIPPALKDVGVFVEPAAVVVKGIVQALEIQRRLKIWKPARAAVLGAGTIGLLATMALSLRGFEVVTFGLQPGPHLRSELIDALGARYVSTKEISLLQQAKASGGFDLIFEATGYSPLAFEAMQALDKNGVLVLASITGGDREIKIPADAINMELVLGNRAVVGTVNANKDHFKQAVSDLVLCEASYGGWLSRLITHRVKGLDSGVRALDLLGKREAIKVVVEVAKHTG